MKKRLLTLVLWPLVLAARAGADIVFADFDGPTFGAWKVEGTAFGPGPSPGPWPGQWRTTGYQGKGLANSFYHGDAATGRLISPEFRIQYPTISFLIGGGDNNGGTRIDLLVNGKVVRSSSGPNARAIGRDELLPDYWEVGDLIGSVAHIEIVDEAVEGPWGHILVDQIVFEAAPRPPLIKNVVRQIVADKAYLSIPIRNDLPKRKLSILADGEEKQYLEIQLADSQPDWWATMEVGALRGKTLTFRVDKLPAGSQGLSGIHATDTKWLPDHLYHERLRPQIHFSAAQGWINDPNGLVFYGGTYHAMFQYNPYGVIGENKHWGHAVSTDLVHWREVGISVTPEPNHGAWSGSGAVDWKNTSGLGTGAVPPIALFYTAIGDPSTQWMSYSLDGGATFAKWSGNPIVPQIVLKNRDPKVIWYEPARKWIMALYVGLKGDGPNFPGRSIQFLSSSNLKQWKKESTLEGFFECPDLFELKVDGNPNERKWVATAGGGEYQVGSFDGKTFRPEGPKRFTFSGPVYYAGQSISDIPASDGRTIRIYWMRLNSPGMNFTHALSVPLETTLRRTEDGLRLASYPVRELLALRRPAARSLDSLSGPLDIEVDAEPAASAPFELTIYGNSVRFDPRTGRLTCADVTAPVRLERGRLRLRILADVTSLEVFAQGGLDVLAAALKEGASSGRVTLQAPNTKASLAVYPLNSIWDPPIPEKVTFTRSSDRVRVEIGGRLFTNYIFRGAPRPYLYPILAPDDTQLNRDYPMKRVKGEETDHPHHRSLWFAHGAVNGIDFWTEGPGKGVIVSEGVEASSAGRVGTLRAQNRWIGPGGALVCTDLTTLRFRGGPEDRVLDYEIAVTAPAGKPVVFGDTKEGSIAIRLPQWMTLTHTYQKRTVPGLGHIVSSRGERDSAVWGKRADWCDYFAPHGGKIYGVALFDHPDNPHHPTWWMARDYGLFGANPFGQHDYENLKDQPHAGDLTIPAGGRVTLRYRFIFHYGDEKAARIAERYRAYADGQ